MNYGFSVIRGRFVINVLGPTMTDKQVEMYENDTPGFYVEFENRGDTAQNISLYIRNGKKSSIFWSDKDTIEPHGSYNMTFYAERGGTWQNFATSWSISLNNKVVKRVGLNITYDESVLSSNSTRNSSTGSTSKNTDGSNIIISHSAAVNVRATPDKNGIRVGHAYPGEEYEVLDESNGWVKIRLSDGTEGWVAESLTKEVK